MITVESEEKKFFTKKNLIKFKGMLVSRQGKINLSIIGGLFLFVLLMLKACEPAKGSIRYGICSAFLEQQIVFPETIEQNYVEQYSSGGVRIYYSHIDAFGQYLTEFIECSFAQTSQNEMVLNGVVFNTIKRTTKKMPIKNKGRLYSVEQKYIDRFNKSYSINIISSQEPDLTLPYNDPVALP